MHGNTETIQLGLLGLIPLLPLLGAIINGLIGSKMSKRFVHTVSTGAMVLAFVLSIVAVVQLVGTGAVDAQGVTEYTPLVYSYFEWFSIGTFSADFGLWLDPLSALMLLIVTGVGMLIHFYSQGYMANDGSYARFFAYLNYFVFSMLMLVLGESILVIFLGWEGVGVASLLLIGYYYEDSANADAGKKAFIVNRVGDFAFLVGMFLLFQLVGTLSVPEVREAISHFTGAQIGQVQGWITAIALVFFIGATGKSAQIPLFVWLPDAMAGPTPVSALMHAATMVTAGVYLVARMNFLFVLSPFVMTLIAVIGLLTAIVAATIGATQFDIKKVLAYSTISQLGFMFIALGTGSMFAGVFHLMTHAFFKALLFLGAGSVIVAMAGEQDMRKMGGLKTSMPITRWTMLIGCLAISGFPLLSGFFSKDEILWFALSNQHSLGGVNLGWVIWAATLATAGLTAFYMFRLYFMTFEGENRADDATREQLQESPVTMTIPLIVLAVLSVIGGFIGVPAVLGEPLGIPNVLHDWLYQVIAPSEALYTTGVADGLIWMSMAASVAVGLTGIGVAYLKYGRGHDPTEDYENSGKIFRVAYDKYYVDEFYAATFGRAISVGGRFLHRVVDEVLIDLLLVRMVGITGRWIGGTLALFQSGNVQRYAGYMVIGLGLILIFLFT